MRPNVLTLDVDYSAILMFDAKNVLLLFRLVTSRLNLFDPFLGVCFV